MPRTVLILGLIALVPFVWGLATMLSDDLAVLSARNFGPRFQGPYLQLAWGSAVLAFLSGVLWGFASKAPAGVAATGYLMAVIPAGWEFLFVGGGPVAASVYLVAGMVGILGIDWLFWQQGLAPHWWMQARAIFTAVAVVCLLPIAA
ncbi:membrane protein [Defluviimonas sp. 20V17]|uniref:Membrane protein n=1 Tax=Allgaiera indica TaxID=765699 RepID=A0AAN4ZZS1_9RHOB|nr:DUF3429 domain-containing protein [Allgaiera indica]KDB02693.1 membrane protein [Defluviimonas sp. 20V17]GHE01774.1 membrane protein [Allgaiera indica]SDW93211.1 Protein of unknown function [Allgaiera indica]